MGTVSHAAQGKLRIPPLEAGDHLDQPTVMDVLRQGLATLEHTAFVQQLQAR